MSKVYWRRAYMPAWYRNGTVNDVEEAERRTFYNLIGETVRYLRQERRATLEMVGWILGIPRERVRQIEMRLKEIP